MHIHSNFVLTNASLYRNSVVVVWIKKKIYIYIYIYMMWLTQHFQGRINSGWYEWIIDCSMCAHIYKRQPWIISKKSIPIPNNKIYIYTEINNISIKVDLYSKQPLGRMGPRLWPTYGLRLVCDQQLESRGCHVVAPPRLTGAHTHALTRGSYPEPLHHVLLGLAVGRDVQDEPAGQVGLVVAHEHVLVLDVLQHQQLTADTHTETQKHRGTGVK